MTCVLSNRGHGENVTETRNTVVLIGSLIKRTKIEFNTNIQNVYGPIKGSTSNFKIIFFLFFLNFLDSPCTPVRYNLDHVWTQKEPGSIQRTHTSSRVWPSSLTRDPYHTSRSRPHLSIITCPLVCGPNRFRYMTIC